MAVAFTSHGYDSTTTSPYTEGVWSDAFPSIGSASYGVRGATDWKVAAVSGQDRTVSIAAGKGFGHGVTDETATNDTIQLDTISSGSRWDLIVCRRDWTPTAGVSQFAKVNGGATQVIPGGRLSDPGGIDDQPLALVQVTAGQTQPTGIIDLRCWSGDGGGILAAHDLVRSYMNAVGTRLNIDGIDWVRRVGPNDVPEWEKVTSQLVQGRAVTVPIASGANSGSVAVTFPTPFTAAPAVSLTKATTSGPASSLRRLTPVATSVTSTGFTATVETVDGAGVGAAFNVACHYTAVQTN